MKKSILMLGASERHLPFIQKAQEKGVIVICIDKDENSPGSKQCNIFAPISIRDKENALWFAEAHGISGCISLPDIGVETCAYINTHLNLRGIKHNTYQEMVHKRKSKLNFREAGVSTPADYPQGKFPYIAKPPDSTGSNGLLKFHNKQQLEGKLLGLRNRDFVIEEFIDGDMFSVDVIMQEGEIKYGLVQDRYLYYDDCFVDSLIISPSQYGTTEHTEILFPICTRALKSVRFTDGPANLQFMVKDDNYYLIEINPRISGPYGIECHTLSTPLDWFEDILKVVLGYKVAKVDLYPLIEPNALVTIGAEADGFITHVTYPDVTGMVTRYWRWKGDGDYVHKFKIVKDSIEHIFIIEKSLHKLLSRANTILKETQVHIGGIS